jgi:hypothetical protein
VLIKHKTQNTKHKTPRQADLIQSKHKHILQIHHLHYYPPLSIIKQPSCVTPKRLHLSFQLHSLSKPSRWWFLPTSLIRSLIKKPMMVLAALLQQTTRVPARTLASWPPLLPPRVPQQTLSSVTKATLQGPNPPAVSMPVEVLVELAVKAQTHALALLARYAKMEAAMAKTLVTRQTSCR